MKDLRQRDGIHRGLAIVLWQIHHARPERHLDLDKGLIAVGQQVLCLARVDANHAEQQVAAGPQRHLDLGLEDALHRQLDVGLKDVGLGQLFVPVGRKPDAGQRPFLVKDKMCVEHDESLKTPVHKKPGIKSSV